MKREATPKGFGTMVTFLTWSVVILGFLWQPMLVFFAILAVVAGQIITEIVQFIRKEMKREQ